MYFCQPPSGSDQSKSERFGRKTKTSKEGLEVVGRRHMGEGLDGVYI
jgi:hypothetical protein